MVMFRCFCYLTRRKKKSKEKKQPSNEGFRTLHVQIEHPGNSSETEALKPSAFNVKVPCRIQKNFRCNVRVLSLESSPVKAEVDEAYEGEDELEDVVSMTRGYSDFDLQARDALASAEGDKEITSPKLFEIRAKKQFEHQTNEDKEKGVDMMQSGHVSDPGIGKTVFWASPKLKRSCSNLERRDVLRKTRQQLHSLRSQSYKDLQEISASQIVNSESPRSVMTHCSADRVMLRRHSSSQVLPSGSRKLWWKLFLWSHRNVHKPWNNELLEPLPNTAACKRPSGYASDTLELKQGNAVGNVQSPGSFTGESFNEICDDENSNNQRWRKFCNTDSGFQPQHQWLAFSAESSSFTRVDEWVNDLEAQQLLPMDDIDNNIGSNVFWPSPEATGSKSRVPTQLVGNPDPDMNLSKEILHANAIVHSLNPTSTTAHISAIGLKVIPTISHFCSLRCVNLSSNSIVRITPGSLPKSIHTLNLSRNKISTIEGLKDLTRLRVLDLSYNCISRIGQGLSNCTPVKELYLAGNKISDVEGLHRLLKLTVLDLSFNKISTTRALGQLVANYSSLQALNLLGNPIQHTISNDHMRKAVCGLLPKLVCLNKQSIKPRRAGEVFADSITKAALGNSSRSSHRKAPKKISQGGSISGGHRSSASSTQKSRQRSRTKMHNNVLSLKGTAY